MSGYGAEGAQGEEPEPIINEKRGFPGNPFSGRHAADPAEPNNAGQPMKLDLSAAELDLAKQEAAERTADLQRVTAEYANYRKRVDRDRESVITAAKSSVIMELLTVLDDLDRARAHGDLVGTFGAVADKLTGALAKLGLKPLGSVGNPFDPAVHEAVQFGTSAEVSEPTVTAVFRSGYTLGEKLVRPAVVVVTGPEHEAVAEPAAAEPIVAAEADGSASAGQGPDPAPAGSSDGGSSGGGSSDGGNEQPA